MLLKDIQKGQSCIVEHICLPFQMNAGWKRLA
mgnify:CR=1 FL=1